MEEVDKKTLEQHTRALNRVADVMGDFLKGLPGFVTQLERNEALIQAQQNRVNTKAHITEEIFKYEKQKEKREKEKEKNQNGTTGNPAGD